MNYAEIIIPLSVAGTFTYAIPQLLENDCAVGKRVLVQFGNKKIYTGIILSIHSNKPSYQTKEIISVIDDYPTVNELQLQFWQWIANYYMCHLGDVYTAAVPVSLRIESQTQIFLAKEIIDEKLTEKETIIVNTLKEQKTLSVSRVGKLTDTKNPIRLVKKLMEKGIIDVYERFNSNYKPKFQKLVKLSDEIKTQDELNAVFDKISRAKKQTDVLLAYLKLSKLHYNNGFVYKEVPKKKLLEEAGASSSIFKALADKNILTEYEKQVSRLGSYDKSEGGIKKLTDVQQSAYNEIVTVFQKKDVVLLHGVTSSGKTEIYIHLIKKYLKQDKQVLYLLPEIALTSQIINRLRSAFGNIVGVYHSKFNDSERAEIWEKINPVDGKSAYKVILGVRSAVFLPFNNLGLIIVDEEHENTYKQFDPAPRYNARDSAIVLAKLHGAKVLLGSATPSLESYYNASKGKYDYVRIEKRFKDMALPEMVIADTLSARREGNMKSIFHPLLIDEINKALKNKEQVILFRNRRGFAPFVQCKSCGWIPYCPHCDVSLTYHFDSNSLVCHYCGYKTSIPQVCKSCGDRSFETRGFGTQKVEDEIKIFFPDARIARLDLDVARQKHGYSDILTRFDTGEIDILIGTQMVTKGLDFDNVRVVGVLNADNLLNFPDFRSFERTFQLITQVSGRAGRMKSRGKVIIQTSKPHHHILEMIINDKWSEFYSFEIRDRKKFAYPPFVRMIKIYFKHKNEEKVENFAIYYADLVKHYFGDNLSGPFPPLIQRIKNYYIREIVLKLNSNFSLDKSKKILMKIGEEVKNISQFSSVIIQFDVDPY